jgi:hypothetical protein
LRTADLQPHRTRSWKTPTLDATFRQRAASILWCYERAWDLAARDELVLCIDEKPNLQVLERRCPTRPARRGQIERREFEYIRHGTVNFLVAFLVHTGEMHGWCLERNDGAHLRAILPAIVDVYQGARKLHVIWDGAPSHTAAETTTLLRTHYPQIRTLITPAHASWLNQAELLIRAFSTRYLTRGDWSSRAAMLEHLDASWHEYNRLFAHPFTWSWTRRKMDAWLDRHAS